MILSIRRLLGAGLLILCNLTAHANDNPEQALQQLACAASIELFMQAADGPIPAKRPNLGQLEKTLPQLQPALQPLTAALLNDLQQAYQQLDQQHELPASFNQDYSQTLLALLIRLHQQPGREQAGSALADLPERLDFVAVLYIARAQIGGLRPALGQDAGYLSLDIDDLVQGIDQDLQRLDSPRPELNDARQRWKFISKQLFEYRHTQSTPLAIQKHTAGMTSSLRQLRSQAG